MNNLLKILIIAASLMPLPLVGQVAVKTTMDSTVLLMGNQTALHIEVLQNRDAQGHFVDEQLRADTLCRLVEIAGRTECDTTDVGNGRVQISRDYILQSFDSGAYVLPPVLYVVGRDTFSSNQLSLKVMPVNVDTLHDIHPYRTAEALPFRWAYIFDYLPDWLVNYWPIWVAMILIIVAGIVVYILLKKREVIKLAPAAPPISPYDEAMQRLEALKSQQLWQAGQDKEYYTQLTEILRCYIDRRFSINAMEMTSSQIIAILRRNHETRAVNEQLNQILEIADFVKFAKVRPLPSDNEASMQRAINFVNETQPVPPPVEAAQGDTNSDDATEVRSHD